jgi:hypothetical protein
VAGVVVAIQSSRNYVSIWWNFEKGGAELLTFMDF